MKNYFIWVYIKYELKGGWILLHARERVGSFSRTQRGVVMFLTSPPAIIKQPRPNDKPISYLPSHYITVTQFKYILIISIAWEFATN